MVWGPTRKAPFTITFGCEVVSPAEVTIPSYRVSYFENKKHITTWLAELDLLEEKKIKA